MVLVSGLMRFWQEYRSGKAAEALKAMVRNTATVLRRDERGMRGELRKSPWANWWSATSCACPPAT